MELPSSYARLWEWAAMELAQALESASEGTKIVNEGIANVFHIRANRSKAPILNLAIWFWATKDS